MQIEARIVIVSDDFSRELGVRAGFTGFDLVRQRPRLHQRLRARPNDTAIADFSERARQSRDPANDARQFRSSVPVGDAAPPRYNVNLPVANPAGSLAFMLLGSDYLVDLEISAAQAEGRGEVISTPRVITANQREASIEQGVEIPYQESASSGATTISVQEGRAGAQGHAADHA